MTEAFVNVEDETACDDEDDRLSICSTVSAGTMGEYEDQRASSSLSVSSSKGSRIPRPLSRSNSFSKEKSQRYSDGNLFSKSFHYEVVPPTVSSTAPRPNSLYRSQSFASSRGMAGLVPCSISSSSSSKAPVTPELKRRKTPVFVSYVSPYSRQAIANERKLYTPQKDFGDSCTSDECTRRSTVAVHSFCGKWQGPQKKNNVLHCSHNTETNDDYLTPTQRAASRIRELQNQLSRARKEIAEKDHQISRLTRSIVENRLHKSESPDFALSSSSRISPSPSTEIPSLATRSFSPSGDASCLTPNSDESGLDFKILLKQKDSWSGLEKHDKRSCDDSPPSPAEESDFGDLNRSLADSGHYEDIPSPCMSSRDSLDTGRSKKLRNSTGPLEDDAMLWAAVGAAEEGVRAEFSRRVEIMKENHMEEYQELKERHNDRVELLLGKLSDANLRYFELRPQFDKAKEKIIELEKDMDSMKEELNQNQIRQQKIYLQMYLKGQQAAKFEAEDKLNGKESIGPHSSDPEVEKVIIEKLKNRDPLLDNNVVLTLMRQLAQSEEEILKLKVIQCSEKETEKGRSRSGSTFSILRRQEIDPEITLQFLKSAIYYFLTDKENAQGHLRAIESILGYNTMERTNINRHMKL